MTCDLRTIAAAEPAGEPQPDAQRTVSLAPQEVAIEFFKRSRPLDDRQCEWLRRRGVSDAAMAADPGYEGAPIRAGRVVFAAGVFDFADDEDEDAVAAFVAIARDERGITSDAVAFDAAGRVACSLKREALLGAQRVITPRLGEPLHIFPTVLEWLASDRRGVVVLDWRLAAGQLAGVSLKTTTVEFGRLLRERLARPAPPIFIEQSEAAA